MMMAHWCIVVLLVDPMSVISGRPMKKEEIKKTDDERWSEFIKHLCGEKNCLDEMLTKEGSEQRPDFIHDKLTTVNQFLKELKRRRKAVGSEKNNSPSLTQARCTASSCGWRG